MRRWSRPLPRTAAGWTIAAWMVGTALIWLWIRSGLAPTTPRPEVLTWRPSMFSLWYSLGMCVPGTLIVRAIARRFGLASSFGRGIGLVLLGVAIWSIGNLTWFWYETCPYWPVLHCSESTVAPYPSPADVAYLLMFPFTIAGAASIGHALGVRRVSVRMLLLLVALLAVSGVIGIQPVDVAGIEVGAGLWVAPDAGALATSISIAYVVGDVLLLWGAFVLVLRAAHVEQGLLRQPLLLLSAGIGCFYTADVAFLHDMQVDSYTEAGFSNSMYAVAIALVVSAAHRATRVESVSPTVELQRRDCMHEAADAIVASQAKLLGTLASGIAETVPGVRVVGGSVTLALPYQDSLRSLVRAYSSRTGHFGRQLAGDALAAVAASHPDGAQLAPTCALLAEQQLGARTRPVAAVTVATGLVVASALAVVGIDAFTGQEKLSEELLWNGLPTLVIVGTFVAGATRMRSKLHRRSQQLELANESLATLLQAVDGTRREERTRVAGEIHDFALQQLLAARMHLERVQAAEPVTPRRIDSKVAAEQLISDSIQQLRRIMEGLEPSALFHRELPAALEELARNVEAAYRVRVTIDAANLPPLQLQQQLLMFRVISEMVTNAGKHAGATHVTVHTDVTGGFLHASVVDDGRGLARRTLVEDRVPASIGRGWGLRLVVEQLALDGGSFRLESAPGQGTRIDIRLPFRGEQPQQADKPVAGRLQLAAGAAD